MYEGSGLAALNKVKPISRTGKITITAEKLPQNRVGMLVHIDRTVRSMSGESVSKRFPLLLPFPRTCMIPAKHNEP